MKAIELYNIMKDYTEEELKEIDIIIEPNRIYKNGITEAYHVNNIESVSNQIRLIHVKDKGVIQHKFSLLEHELQETFPTSKFKVVLVENIINILYTDCYLRSDKFIDDVYNICEKYLSEAELFNIAILYDYFGEVKNNN